MARHQAVCVLLGALGGAVSSSNAAVIALMSSVHFKRVICMMHIRSVWGVYVSRSAARVQYMLVGTSIDSSVETKDTYRLESGAGDYCR
jgi:uncharacterized membrane protein